MNELEKFTNAAGNTVTIYYDDCAESPREWDNMWEWTSNYRRITLNESSLTLDEIATNHKQLERTHLLVPVYMYMHSGVALSLSPFADKWDSGVGFFAIVSKASLRKEYGCERVTNSIIERAMNVLKGEAEVFGAYLNGEVYGWVETDQNGDEIDSCWGYYGDDGIESIKAEHLNDTIEVPDTVEADICAA